MIPSPYWVSYEDITVLTSAKAKIISTTIEDNFKITPEQLDNALTEKTKLVFLNSPSNPTGSVYTKEELLQLATVFQKYPNMIIASDDIYEHIN